MQCREPKWWCQCHCFPMTTARGKSQECSQQRVRWANEFIVLAHEVSNTIQSVTVSLFSKLWNIRTRGALVKLLKDYLKTKMNLPRKQVSRNTNTYATVIWLSHQPQWPPNSTGRTEKLILETDRQYEASRGTPGKETEFWKGAMEKYLEIWPRRVAALRRWKDESYVKLYLQTLGQENRKKQHGEPEENPALFCYNFLWWWCVFVARSNEDGSTDGSRPSRDQLSWTCLLGRLCTMTKSQPIRNSIYLLYIPSA